MTVNPDGSSPQSDEPPNRRIVHQRLAAPGQVGLGLLAAGKHPPTHYSNLPDINMTGAPTTHHMDSHLLDRVDEALTTNPHLLGRKFGYHADEGIVVLTGKVNSFFQKQMAQEAIRRVDGVQYIDNQLEVDWH